jgi:hypothetical protein
LTIFFIVFASAVILLYLLVNKSIEAFGVKYCGLDVPVNFSDNILKFFFAFSLLFEETLRIAACVRIFFGIPIAFLFSI